MHTKAYVILDRAVALRHEQFLNLRALSDFISHYNDYKTHPWNRPDQSEHSYAASMR